MDLPSLCSNCETVPSELKCIQCTEAQEENLFCESCSEIHVLVKKFKQHTFEKVFRFGNQKCCNCDLQISTHRCLDCVDGEQYLCHSCASFHVKLKSFKGHRVAEHSNVLAADDEKGDSTKATAVASVSPPSERKESNSSVEKEATSQLELQWKENELFGKREALDVEYDLIEIQQSNLEQKRCELEEALKSERGKHWLQLIERKTEHFKGKKTLKELGKKWKQEEANLERIFRRKELENRQERTRVEAVALREAESLFSRDVDLFEELESFHREKYAGNETYLQQMLPFLRVKKEELLAKLLAAQEKRRVYEGDEVSISKELDVINEAIGSNGEGTTLLL